MEGLEQGRKEKPLFTLKGVLVRAGGVAQWLECLPSMQEAPRFNPQHPQHHVQQTWWCTSNPSSLEVKAGGSEV